MAGQQTLDLPIGVRIPAPQFLLWFLLWIPSLFAVSLCQAAESMQKASLFFTEVKLDGKGPFNFIIDTGAMASVISESLFQSLEAEADVNYGIKMGIGDKKRGEASELLRANFQSMELAGLAVSPFRPFVMKLSQLQGAVSKQLDGIIGYDVLKDYEVALDYIQGKVELYSPDSSRIDRNSAVGIEIYMNHIYIPVTLSGHKLHFLLDTGASHCVLSSAIVDSLQLDRYLTLSDNDTLIGISGVADTTIDTYVLPSITVDGKEVKDITITVLNLSDLSGLLGRDIQGVIGQNFLKHFTVRINYQEKLLELWKVHPQE